MRFMYASQSKFATENQKLQEVLGFTAQEPAMNRAGMLSNRQSEHLKKVIRLRRTSGSFAVIGFMVSMIVLWVVGYSLLLEEKDSFKLQSQYSLIFGSWIMIGLAVGAIFAVFLWIDRKRIVELKSGRVNMVEGSAMLHTKEMKGSMLYGMMAHYVTVGQVQFQLLDAKEYGAFEEESTYRIYYVKNPPTHTILSVEWLG